MSSRLISSTISSASTLRNITSASHRLHDPTTAAPISTIRRSSTATPIKRGTVMTFDETRNFGFIKPDDIDPAHANDWQKNSVFVHSADVKTLPIRGEILRPQLKPKMRVQFKAAPAIAGKTSLKATEVTMEDGSLVPPFQPFYLDGFIKRKKAKFGDILFDIMEEATDRGEMEKRIVEAFEECTFLIEKQRARVKRIEGVYKKEGSERGDVVQVA